MYTYENHLKICLQITCLQRTTNSNILFRHNIDEYWLPVRCASE